MPQDDRAVAVDAFSVRPSFPLERQHADYSFAVFHRCIAVESDCSGYSAHLNYLNQLFRSDLSRAAKSQAYACVVVFWEAAGVFWDCV